VVELVNSLKSPAVTNQLKWFPRQVGQAVLHCLLKSHQAVLCVLTRKLECILSGGGRYLGSLIPGRKYSTPYPPVYPALSNPETCSELARKLVICRGQGQRKFLSVGEDSSSRI